MNTLFQTIHLKRPQDWVRALQEIKAHDLDVLIIDQSTVDEECGKRLAETAKAQGWGICAAITLTTFNVLGGKEFGVWSAGRKVVSALGHTCELSNSGYGELVHQIKPLEKAGCESIWGSAVYITRDTLNRITGFDISFNQLTSSEAVVPNLIWDDLCLQARLKGIGVGYDFKVQAKIDISQTIFPNETNHGYARWTEKWGWNPLLPNLYEIRDRWQGTALARPIMEDLLDPASFTPYPQVEGIMLTCNSLDKLRLTLAALAKTDYPNFRLKILMNGSPDKVRKELENQKEQLPFPLDLLHCPVNVGVSPGLNWLKSQCGTAPIIARLDDDIEMPSHWLKEMVGILQQYPFSGAVLPSWRIPLPNGSMATVTQLRVHPNFCSKEPIEFAAPATSLHLTNFMGGACVVYRRKAFDLAGSYDLRFAPSQHEDVDHGLSLRSVGYDIMELGSLSFIHHTNFVLGNSLNNSMTLTHQRSILAKKWGRALGVLETSLDHYGRIVQLHESELLEAIPC